MATTLPLCVHSLKLHEAFFQLHFQPAWSLFASFWAKLGGSDNQAPTLFFVVLLWSHPLDVSSTGKKKVQKNSKNSGETPASQHFEH